MKKKLFCPYCGEMLASDVKFCSKCGAKIPDVDEIETKIVEKEKLTFMKVIEKLPSKPSFRLRLMFGFILVAVISLLLGYYIAAFAFAIDAILLTSKIFSKIRKKKILMVIVVATCAVIGVLSFGIKELDKEYILAVKEGTFDSYPDTLIGEAFDDFFSNPKWEYFITDEGKDVVEFTGGCNYNGSDVTALVQFTVYEDKTFEMTYLSYNDVTQNMSDYNELLSIVFE